MMMMPTVYITHMDQWLGPSDQWTVELIYPGRPASELASIHCNWPIKTRRNGVILSWSLLLYMLLKRSLTSLSMLSQELSYTYYMLGEESNQRLHVGSGRSRARSASKRRRGAGFGIRSLAGPPDQYWPSDHGEARWKWIWAYIIILWGFLGAPTGVREGNVICVGDNFLRGPSEA